MREQIEEIIRDAREQRSVGRVTAARSGYGRAADLARAAHEHGLLAHALRHLSELDRLGGDHAAALIAGSEAVALYRENPDAAQLDLANALRVSALALDALGRPHDAGSVWREARNLYAQLDVTEGVAECDSQLGKAN